MNKTTEENVIDVQKLNGLTYSWQTWHYRHRLHRVQNKFFALQLEPSLVRIIDNA